MLTDRDKVIEYELQIEDMLKTLTDRLSELNDSKTLDEFDQGRQLAYAEMLDIIQTRHQMILDVLR